MGLEVEAKLKVEAHQPLRERLTALGAQCVSRVVETNHIFDNADRVLLAGDRGLRVREYRTIEGQTPSATLTYKGPRRDATYKQREEIEIAVSPPADAVVLLTALGFVEVLCFEKRRETWRLNDCLVELDELPHLGLFVEIEGPEAETVHRMQEMLGLGDLAHVKNSYIALLAEYCREHDLPSRQIMFS